MKKILTILLTFFLGTVIVNADTTKEEATFVRCVDGDTALFKIGDTETKFRFLAIDTPETVHPTKEVEAYGKDASEYTCNRLTNAKEIVVEYENNNKTDKYGRSLAWIWVDGNLLQKELVEAGYAEVAYIYGTYKYTLSLCVVQQNAKYNNNGIWHETRDEGYCSTIDLEDAKDTINEDYESSETVHAAVKKKKTSKKDTKKEEEETANTVKEKIEKYDEINDDISDFMESETFKKAFFYTFMAIAVVTALIKAIKK